MRCIEKLTHATSPDGLKCRCKPPRNGCFVGAPGRSARCGQTARFPIQGDGVDRIVDPVVVHKIATVIGLAGQGSRGPAVAQHFGLQFIQPGLEPGQRRHGMRVSMTFRYGIFAQCQGLYLWSPQGAERLGNKTLTVGSVVGTLAALASLFMAEGQ